MKVVRFDHGGEFYGRYSEGSQLMGPLTTYQNHDEYMSFTRVSFG